MNMEFDELAKALESITEVTQHSPQECGEAIHNFADGFLNLTEEEKWNIVVDYFKNPPTDDDKQAIKEFSYRHPGAAVLEYSENWMK